MPLTLLTLTIVFSLNLPIFPLCFPLPHLIKDSSFDGRDRDIDIQLSWEHLL